MFQQRPNCFKRPATKQIAGSTPFLTNKANTYAATAYVDAKDKSISPDAKKNKWNG